MASEKQYPQQMVLHTSENLEQDNPFQPFRCPNYGSHHIEEDESYSYECGRRYGDDRWAFCLDCDWTDRKGSVFDPMDEEDEIPF